MDLVAGAVGLEWEEDPFLSFSALISPTRVSPGAQDGRPHPLGSL